jgi:hypothetical protein
MNKLPNGLYSKVQPHFSCGKVIVTFFRTSERRSRCKRNKWKGPCVVKGRPDPVGGRNLPGKSCSTRKQSEREGLATVLNEAFDAKGPARPDQRALRP